MAEKRNKRWVIPGAVAALIVIVLIFLATPGRGPKVPVISVGRGNISEVKTGNGKVEPISPVIARAQFPAFVQKIAAAEGQPVHRGELILSLGDADIQSELARTKADLLAAQSDLDHARSGGPPDQRAQLDADLQSARLEEVNRSRSLQEEQSLLKAKAATVDDVAQAQAALVKAQGNVSALEEKRKAMQQSAATAVKGDTLRVTQDTAAIQSLQHKVDSAHVTSPIDGTLYSLDVHAGDYVQTGDVLARMANLKHVRIRADFDEPDLGQIGPNQDVKVAWDAKPGLTWTGRTEVAPKQVVKLGDRNVGEVLCSVDNDQLQLLPGANVEVQITVKQSSAPLVIPRAAIQYDRHDSAQRFVWIVSGNQVQRRNISLGIASATQYEVLAGLKPGEQVAVPGQRELHEGMTIRPTEAE